MGLKEWIISRKIRQNEEDSMLGKLGPGAAYTWRLLSGWKSWIVAVIGVWKLVCIGCSSNGYLDSALAALGWNTTQAAFDPVETFKALCVLIALGDHLLVAVKQYRAGIPLDQLHSLPYIDASGKQAQ